MAANTRFSRGKTSFLLPLEKNFFRHRQRHAKKFPVIAEGIQKRKSSRRQEEFQAPS